MAKNASASTTEMDRLRDRIVALVTKDKHLTFKAALKNRAKLVLEEWVVGKRIRGVYLGAFVWREWEFRAIMATDGTLQVFQEMAGVRKRVPQLDRVPVGALVSVEMGDDTFHVKSKPWKRLT
jgi:hypothetical protein